MKRLFALVLALAMLLSVAITGLAEVATPEGSDITATIVVGGWPSGDDGLRATEEGFHALYPNITVEYEFTDSTTFYNNLKTALAADSGAPDVAMVNANEIGTIRTYGSKLVNLLEEPYNAGKYENSFVEMKWKSAYSLDKTALYGISWDIGPTSYFYRRDVFAEAGLPSEPEEVYELMKTWDGCLEVAEKVNAIGCYFMPDVAYFYEHLLNSKNAFFAPDLSVDIHVDGELELLDFCRTVRANGWDGNSDMWSTEAYAGYASGIFAGVASGAWFGGFLKTDIDPEGVGNWGVVRLPGNIPAANAGGSFMVIPAQSEQKEAAWKFIEYTMCTPEGQNAIFEAVDYYPSLKAAWNSEIYDVADPYFGGEVTRRMWADIADTYSTESFVTSMDADAGGAVYNTTTLALTNGLSPEEIVAAVEQAITEAIGDGPAQEKQARIDAGVWTE